MIRRHTVAVIALTCIAVLLASQTSAHALCLYGCWNVLTMRVIVIDTTSHHPVASRPMARAATPRITTPSRTTSTAGACRRGGEHTPGKRDSNGRLHCAKCGQYM